MPETRPESSSSLAITAKRPSCVGPRAAGNTPLRPRCLCRPRRRTSRHDHHLPADAATRCWIRTLHWVNCARCTAGQRRRIPTAAAMTRAPEASRMPSAWATRSSRCATAHAGWSSFDSASTRWSATWALKQIAPSAATSSSTSGASDEGCCGSPPTSTNSSSPGARIPVSWKRTPFALRSATALERPQSHGPIELGKRALTVRGEGTQVIFGKC
jgi:hypothetical protein